MQKVTTRILSQETSRLRKPRSSAPQLQLRTATIKTFQGSFEVLQTSIQHTAAADSQKQNLILAALGGFLPGGEAAKLPRRFVAQNATIAK